MSVKNNINVYIGARDVVCGKGHEATMKNGNEDPEVNWN